MRTPFSWHNLAVALLLIIPILIAAALGIPAISDQGGYDANFALNLTHLTTEAFQTHHIFSRWLWEGNEGFGSPVFYFYGLLPFAAIGLLSAILHLPATVGLAVGMALARLLSFFTCRLWLARSFDPRLASLGALLFVSFPFIFLENPFLRCAYAEMSATALLPLLFLGSDAPRTKHGTFLAVAVVTALLALTHLPQTALGLLCLAAYAWIGRGWRHSFLCCSAAVMGLALSGFSVIPALTLQPFINATAWLNNENLNPSYHFLFDPAHLRHSWYRKFSEACLHGSWLLAFGVFLVSLSSRSVRKLLLHRKHLAVLSVVALTLAGMTDLAWYPWMHVGFLYKLQFPWRLLPSCLLMASAAALIAIDRWQIRYSTVIAAPAALIAVQTGSQIVCFAAGVHLLPERVCRALENRIPSYVSWQDRSLHKWLTAAANAPEYLPREAAGSGWGFKNTGLHKRPALNPAEVSSPGSYQRDGESFILTSSADRANDYILPQFYFPGWSLLNPPLGATLAADRSTGLLRVTLPPGYATVKVQRALLPQAQIGMNVSITACMSLLLCALSLRAQRVSFEMKVGELETAAVYS